MRTSGLETAMAPRWFKRFFKSAKVIIAALLFSAEVATAIVIGHDLTNTELAVLLALANAVSIVLTAMVPEIQSLWVTAKHSDLEKGSSLRRTMSAPASPVESVSLDLDLGHSTSALSALILEAGDPDCVISSVGELGPGPEETRCWRTAQQYSTTSSDG